MMMMVDDDDDDEKIDYILIFGQILVVILKTFR